MSRVAALLAAGAALVATPAAARVLAVGPGQPFARPSDAARVARDGDTVAIAPGAYFDCAVWSANRLTITGDAGAGDAGAGDAGAVLTDRACEGKAAFVIRGDDVTVRGLTFARIRVPDGNGAGIRAEGRGLTVEHSRFDNDQVGVLAGGGGALRIADCTFTGGGFDADGRPTHAVLAGALDLLSIARSRFAGARGGDHIVSAARRTELTGNDLSDPDGRISGPLVRLQGGALTLQGNTVTLGANPPARPGAVLVTGDVATLSVRGNRLIAPDGATPLVRNWSTATAEAADNTVPEHALAVSDEGARYHRLRAWLAAQRDAARKLAGHLARALGVIR